MTQRIVPYLWFDDAAEDAARFYTGLIPGSLITAVSRYSKAGFEQHGQPEGKAMVAEFEIAGFRMAGLNGGPMFKRTPAISYFLTLEDTDEVERVWAALAEGGEVLMPLDAYDWSPRYGWLNDRFGTSWHVSLGSRADVGGLSVVPFLLFTRTQAGQAEAAVEHYTHVFPTSRIEGIMRHDGSGDDAAGTVLHAQFYLDGQTFMAMDSAQVHDFGFTEGNSLLVRCDSQDEIDHYWNALSAVPDAERCGWLKDRFGVSWQIVPRRLPELLSARSGVMEAFMEMKKLDIAKLEAAAR